MLPNISELVPKLIADRFSIVKEIAMDLFKSNDVKAPSDVLTNDLNNTFLHTYYG